MSEAAGARRLEDILASIRQSLAEETVDGLVELSAAAAAAARAEARVQLAPAPAASSDSDAEQYEDLTEEPLSEEDDSLRLKLLGALASDPPEGDDLSDLLETPPAAATPRTDPGDETASPHTPQSAEPKVPPPDETIPETPAEPAIQKLWFLRPGAPEPKSSGRSAAPLRLDPFADGAEKTSTGKDGELPSPFALSPKAIIGGASETRQPSLPVAPASSGAPPLPEEQPASKVQAPRLDRTQIELINRLKASSTAAVASLSDPTEAETGASQPPATMERASDAVAPEDQGQSTETAAEVPTVAAGPLTSAEARTLLTLPERSTPLFVSASDKTRPIVSAPDLPLSTGETLIEPEPEVTPAAAEVPVASTLDSLTMRLAPSATEEDISPVPDADDDGMSPLVQEAEPHVPPPDAAATDETVSSSVEGPDVPVSDGVPPESDAAPAPAVAEIHRIKTVASPVPSPAGTSTNFPPTPAAAVMAAGRPLEEMIASVLEPVLQRLLEKNLTPLVEDIVRREVEVALKGRQSD